MVRLLPAAGRAAMPWKNGGGSTVEVAISPDNASLHNFDWRISVAAINNSSAFSSFHGVDRSLALLLGGPLQLEIDSAAATVSPYQPQISFAGEAQIAARPARATTVFNVMTRRGRCQHRLLHVDINDNLAHPYRLQCAPGTTLAFLAAGHATILQNNASSHTLQLDDALLIEISHHEEWAIYSQDYARILICHLSGCGHAG